MDTEADLQFRPQTGKLRQLLLPEVEAYQLLMVIFLRTASATKEVSEQSV